jgi:septum formation protein
MVPPGVEEATSHLSPHDEALQLARCKALAVAERFPGAVVIGSDTLLSLGGEKIGKPKNLQDAVKILTHLRGRVHDVVTAIVVVSPTAKNVEHVESSRVTMRDYTDQELERYAQLGECLDKAGAYSAQGQGRSLIASLKGDYLAIVGLPLGAVAAALRQVGIQTPVDVEAIYRERKALNWPAFDLSEPAGRTGRKKTASSSPPENPSTTE